MLQCNIRSCLPLATVWLDAVDATEDLQGRVTLDAMFSAEICLLCAVNLGQGNVLVLERGGGFLVLGGEGLAVTAPRGEDCNEKPQSASHLPTSVYIFIYI